MRLLLGRQRKAEALVLLLEATEVIAQSADVGQVLLAFVAPSRCVW